MRKGTPVNPEVETVEIGEPDSTECLRFFWWRWSYCLGIGTKPWRWWSEAKKKIMKADGLTSKMISTSKTKYDQRDPATPRKVAHFKILSERSSKSISKFDCFVFFSSHKKDLLPERLCGCLWKGLKGSKLGGTWSKKFCEKEKCKWQNGQ